MDSHFFYRKKITFILSNEHVYDLNVQYDLIWWEYAWMDFKPGMWISYMALEVFRITNLHCCQTHCTFLPILNSGFLIQTGNQYILFKKWNEFQIIRLIIEIYRKSYDPRKKNKHYIDDDDDDHSVVCMQNKTQFTLFLCLLRFYSKPNMYMMTVW